MIHHIRKAKQSAKDRRTRGFRGLNATKPVLCGGEPTYDDMGRDEGEQWLAVWRPMLGRPQAPSWVATMDPHVCEACLAIVRAKKGERAA